MGICRLAIGDLPRDRVFLLEGGQPRVAQRQDQAAVHREVPQRPGSGRKLGRLDDFAIGKRDAPERAVSQREIKNPLGDDAAAAGRALRFLDRRGPLGRPCFEGQGGHRCFADDQHAFLIDAGQVQMVLALLHLPAGQPGRKVDADQDGLFARRVDDVVAGDHRGGGTPLFVERRRRDERFTLFAFAAFGTGPRRSVAIHPQHGMIESIDADEPTDGRRADQNAVRVRDLRGPPATAQILLDLGVRMGQKLRPADPPRGGIESVQADIEVPFADDE